MSIRLSEEDRGCLERLAGRPTKPTRRQEAIALLRLDEGRSPAQAAESAGISEEEVEALAAGFAEGGLAGVGLDAEPTIRVQFVRTGVGVQECPLPEGATLAELLRRLGVATTDQDVYVDGVVAEEAGPLHDGAIVMVLPQSPRAAVDQPWRATIPSFRDDALFRQYADRLESRRRQLGPDEDEDP
jgi:hypothetical protein